MDLNNVQAVERVPFGQGSVSLALWAADVIKRFLAIFEKCGITRHALLESELQQKCHPEHFILSVDLESEEPGKGYSQELSLMFEGKSLGEQEHALVGFSVHRDYFFGQRPAPVWPEDYQSCEFSLVFASHIAGFADVVGKQSVPELRSILRACFKALKLKANAIDLDGRDPDYGKLFKKQLGKPITLAEADSLAIPSEHAWKLVELIVSEVVALTAKPAARPKPKPRPKRKPTMAPTVR